MNQHQKNYALNRIEALKTIKIRQANDKFTTKEVKISDEQAYKLIATGKVKIRPYLEIKQHYSSPDLFPSFDFSDYEKKSKLDESKFIPLRDSICDISQKAKDQIMLGDCDEALRLINELESIKV